MRIAGLFTAIAIAAAAGLTAAPAAAQEVPPAVSDPLKNYNLDVLVPARPTDTVGARQSIAQEWVANAKVYRERAVKGRELVRTRLTAKEIEIKALEARVKEAKVTDNKTEVASLKAQIDGQKSQLNALQGISDYFGNWDDLASALDKAGSEWLEFLEAEKAVAQRQEGLSRELVRNADNPLAGQPNVDDFKLHRTLIEEYQEYGAALENLGKATKKLGESSAKVLANWEKHNLTVKK